MGYAYVVGSITSTVQTMEAGTRKYQELMDQLNVFLEENNVENDLRVTARAYFRTRHQAGNLVDWRELLNEMSPDLRESIASTSHQNWVGESSYFIGKATSWQVPSDFVGKAAALFQEITYPRGERIIEIGQPVDAVYVIKRGVVWSNGRVFCKGGLFGEDVVLDATDPDRRSPYVAMALTFVQLQSLDYEELQDLLEEFPQVMRQTERAALRTRFKRHVYSYASALRELNGLKPLGALPDRGLIEHYTWKLKWLKMDGLSGAKFFKSIIKIQAAFRGSQGRKRVSDIKDSLLVQLDKRVQRSVARAQNEIQSSVGAVSAAGHPEAPVLLQKLLDQLSVMSDRIVQLEAKLSSESTLHQISTRIDSIDQKLGNNSKPGGPPPLPMAGPPLPMAK